MTPTLLVCQRARFLRRCLSVILLLLFACACASAEVSFTVSPSTIEDPTKPPRIVLNITVTAPDNLDISGFKVTVGDRPVDGLAIDNANKQISFTPPQNLPGRQIVRLLDQTGAVKTSGDVFYASKNVPEGPWDKWIYYGVRALLAGAAFLGILWVGGWTIYHTINFSKSSFRSPLGLPVGSLRAILAYTLVAFVGLYVFVSVLSFSEFAPPQFLLGTVATVIGFYFGSRNGEEGDDSTLGIVRGIVRNGNDPVVGAQVNFKTGDGKIPYIRVTDVAGRFEPVKARAGTYKISATMAGKPSSEQEITVSDSSDHEIAIDFKAANPTNAPNATTGTITGTVNLPADQGAAPGPASGATVTLTSGGTPLKATTDAQGKFTFKDIPPGAVTIVAALQGFQQTTPQNVTVKAGETQTVTLALAHA